MPLRASWAILATHEGQGRGVSEVRFQGIVEPHQSHLRVHGGPDGLVELFIYGRVAAPRPWAHCAVSVPTAVGSMRHGAIAACNVR